MKIYALYFKKLVKEVIKIGSSSEYKVYAALRMIEQLTDDDLLDRYIFKNILKDYENIVDTTKFNRNEKSSGFFCHDYGEQCQCDRR